VNWQVSTTKGTGGDVIILEEAAYCDPGFFYETVAPLMLIGRTSLLAISTLTSEINFYTRLIKMKDPTTLEPMFSTFCVELSCQACKDEGKQVDCKHMLHLVPAWQSSQKHIRLKTIMQDRPDLIQSELSGLAFDALQQAFRKADLDTMAATTSPSIVLYENIYIFIDPAAGGPSSDYAVLSVTRWRGMVTVKPLHAHATRYSSRRVVTRSLMPSPWFWSHKGIISRLILRKKLSSFVASACLAPVMAYDCLVVTCDTSVMLRAAARRAWF
jgi:hypothetical protein